MPGYKRKRVSAKPSKSSDASKRKKRFETRLIPRRGIMSNYLSKTLLSPFPVQLRATMRYFSQSFTLNGGAGGLAANHVFSANGCYDPDISGVGHQVVGFDQMTPIYDHYTVVGAKLVMDIRNDDTANPYNVGIRVSDTNSTLTDPRQIVENGYNTYKLLNFGPNQPCVARLSLSVDIAKYLGRKDVLADAELKGTAGSNPTEQVYFHCFAFTLGAIDGGDITAQACIEYDVIWHERVAVSVS